MTLCHLDTDPLAVIISTFDLGAGDGCVEVIHRQIEALWLRDFYVGDGLAGQRLVYLAGED